MSPPYGRRNINSELYKMPMPKSIREVPSYIKTLFCSFVSRLFYIYRLVWEAKKVLLIVMVFLSVAEGVFPIIGAYIGAEILNILSKVITHEISSFSSIYPLLIFQALYLLATRLVTRIYNVVVRLSGEIVSNHIKLKIMNKSKEVDLGAYDKPDFYAMLENANREAGSRPVETLRSSLNVVSAVTSLVSFAVILSAVSWWSPLLIAVFSLPVAIVSFIYRRKNVNYMVHHSKERRQMNYYADVLINKDMVKEVRLFGSADSIIGRYSAVFKHYFRGIKRLVIGENVWGFTAGLVNTLMQCLLLIFVAYGVFEGKFLIGNYSLYASALNNIGSNITTLISTAAVIYEGTLFINNLIAYLKEKPTVIPSVDEPLKPTRHKGHTIEFKNVSFHYPGTTVDTLKKINLTINAGETIVIVGLNGAGKTTLIKLLTRLYDPTDGVILLDGIDIKEYDTAALYDIFGIIFQDFGKYAMTVAENIALGQISKGVVPEDVKNAADEAGASDFIERLTNGYDTPLMRWFEENGTELSIGQWQKLSIARAFYSNSDILILDEPTASLDPMAEQEIFNEFDNLREDKTTIFVSHRLSSATIADKILVLEYGKIVEIGNHSELMNKKGKYYSLFTTQAKRYMTPIYEDETAETDKKSSYPHDFC